MLKIYSILRIRLPVVPALFVSRKANISHVFIRAKYLAVSKPIPRLAPVIITTILKIGFEFVFLQLYHKDKKEV